MSFYGNILNRLDKYWNKIKVSRSEEDYDELVAPKDGSSELELTSSGGLIITTANNNSINFSTNNLLIDVNKDNNSEDGKLAYTIKQGNTEFNIDIPLDLILERAEVVEDYTDNDDSFHKGTFIKMVFNTIDNKKNIVYVDVTKLNEIAGSATDTITVSIDGNQKITAKVNDKSITTNELADNAVTTDKIADNAVTTDKIEDSNITTDKIAENAITAEKLSSDIIIVENNTLKILQLGKEETK